MSKPGEPEQDPLMHPPGTAAWEKQDRPDAGWSWPTLAFVGLIMGAMVLGLLWSNNLPPDVAHRMQCQNNLKQVGLALQHYSDDYGSFPPAYVADSTERPMHSWRALLLPYLDPVLAKYYNFDEPWDGPSNSKLANRMPEVYRCRLDKSAPPGSTNYVAIVGNETMWPFAAGRKAAEVTDGLSNTIQLVEVTGLNIPWLEPRDLEFGKLTFKVNDPSAQGIGSLHPDGANVVLADRTTRTLKPDTPAEMIRALLTIDGGEKTARQE